MAEMLVEGFAEGCFGHFVESRKRRNDLRMWMVSGVRDQREVDDGATTANHSACDLAPCGLVFMPTLGYSLLALNQPTAQLGSGRRRRKNGHKVAVGSGLFRDGLAGRECEEFCVFGFVGI